MIFVAIGDAIVRLSRNGNDASSVVDLLESQNDMLIDGALRAMAMLKMVPSPDQIDQILQAESSRPLDETSSFWILAAAPGWSGESVARFLDEYSRSSSSEMAKAADLAAKKKYMEWNPL